jgi:hypothetical protein
MGFDVSICGYPSLSWHCLRVGHRVQQGRQSRPRKRSCEHASGSGCPMSSVEYSVAEYAESSVREIRFIRLPHELRRRSKCTEYSLVHVECDALGQSLVYRLAHELLPPERAHGATRAASKQAASVAWGHESTLTPSCRSRSKSRSKRPCTCRACLSWAASRKAAAAQAEQARPGRQCRADNAEQTMLSRPGRAGNAEQTMLSRQC